MIGIDSNNGRYVSGIKRLRQSIRDILTTRLGTRVMRRDYGSRIPDLIDAPTNRSTILQIISATAEAIARWEPEFVVERVVVSVAEPGRVLLDVLGRYTPEGRSVLIDGIEVTQ